MIFTIKGFRTIVFIFIVISATFQPVFSPAFFRCLSNSGPFRSSVKVPEFDKHLKKAGGHTGRNVVEITNEDNCPKTLNDKNRLGLVTWFNGVSTLHDYLMPYYTML